MTNAGGTGTGSFCCAAAPAQFACPFAAAARRAHYCCPPLPPVAQTLLHLGIRNIRLGPRLPAFLTDEALQARTLCAAAPPRLLSPASPVRCLLRAVAPLLPQTPSPPPPHINARTPPLPNPGAGVQVQHHARLRRAPTAALPPHTQNIDTPPILILNSPGAGREVQHHACLPVGARGGPEAHDGQQVRRRRGGCQQVRRHDLPGGGMMANKQERRRGGSPSAVTKRGLTANT